MFERTNYPSSFPRVFTITVAGKRSKVLGYVGYMKITRVILKRTLPCLFVEWSLCRYIR